VNDTTTIKAIRTAIETTWIKKVKKQKNMAVKDTVSAHLSVVK